MTDRPLAVALVGAAPDHWSGTAHMPAIRAVDDLELRWVVTSTAESARAAGTRFGADATHELSRVLDDEGVDIVTVTVKVPDHAAIATAAIEAGKHVYCEWPLAVSPAEARDLAALSAAHDDRLHITGLQGRFSPELRAAGDLVRAGRVGEPLAASMRLFLPLGLVPRPAHRAHLRHRSVAANVHTIHAGHALDMLGTVLGAARPRYARMWTAVPEFVVAETGERLPRDAPDNLVVALDYGDVVASTQFSHTAARSWFDLEIFGRSGSVRLTATDQPQLAPLEVTVTELGADKPTALPPEDHTGVAALARHAPGFTVARLYATLAHAVRTGEHDQLLPTFAEAVVLHDLLESVTAVANGETAGSVDGTVISGS